MRVKLEHLVALFPATPKATLQLYVDPLNETIERWSINNVPMFLAQVGHESGGFVFVKENLNYSTTGLLKTFRKYFDGKNATAYARKPERIANRVYANRLGNGPEASGEGWAYRGRGLMQLTGKANYQAYATDCKMTLAEATAFLETPKGAADVAGWFWSTRNINAISSDVVKTTLKINGGKNGLDHRTQLYAKARKILG